MRHLHRRPASRALAVMGAVVAVAAAGVVPAGAQKGGGEGTPETTSIRVGVIPTTGAAALYLADERGYFEEEGIEEVEAKLAVTGVTEALIGGEYDFVYSAYVVPFQARDQGLPIAIAAAADEVPPSSESTPGARRPGVIVLPDSEIERPKDLEGKTVGVPTVSIGEVLLYPALKRAKVDVDEVELVEVFIPQELQALEQGQVDAVFAPEPYYTEAEETLDVRNVFDAFADSKHTFSIAGYETTEDFADKNPNTVAAFRRAIEQAAKELNEPDRQAFVEILPSYMGLSREQAEGLIPTTFAESINVKDLQRVANSMKKLGLLDEKLKVKEMVIK